MSENMIQELPNLVGKEDQNNLMEMCKPGFMARVQLCGGSSGMVKDEKVPIGQFAFIRSKDDFIVLGKEFLCIPLSWRSVAMRFGDETVESVYDKNSPEFKQIQIDSEGADSGCAYGPQFLIWVPAVKDYATFLLGSKSARPEGRKAHAQLNKPTMFKSALIEAGGYKWHAPKVMPYTGEINPRPDVETAIKTAEMFNNPEVVAPSQEPVSEGAGGDQRPR